MWKKNKKFILALFLLIFILSLLFFVKSKKNNEYCDILFNTAKCNGQMIRIVGTNPVFDDNHGVEQHPIVNISFDKNGVLQENQKYLNTRMGQIILLTKDEISCQNKIEVVGVLQNNIGPCGKEKGVKTEYCGKAIDVKEWKCIK